MRGRLLHLPFQIRASIPRHVAMAEACKPGMSLRDGQHWRILALELVVFFKAGTL